MYLFRTGVDVTNPNNSYASNTTNQNLKQIDTVLNVSGTWSFTVVHGITSNRTTLSNITIRAYTFSDNECLNFCSGKSHSLGL